LTGASAGFSGSIVALAPQSYAAQTLALPEQPQRIVTTLFDAERSALFVAGSFSQSSNNKLWRYTYSGSTWTAAPEVSIPGLCALTFSNDGSKLLALADYSLLQLDPANPSLATATTIAAPFQQSSTTGSPYFTGMALANDGYALVSTGILNGTGDVATYLYSSTAASFIELGATLLLYSWPSGGSPALAASADGSLVLAAQTGVNPTPPVFQYSPETTLMTQTRINSNQLSGQPAVMDSSAAKRVVYDKNTSSVYDSNFALLGNIPGTVRVLTVNRQGTRLYALNQDSTLHTYDLAAATVGGNYPEMGSGNAQTVPASGAGLAVRLAISPDGGTLFLVGDTGVAVIPAP
jgi:hypothetical protein